MTMTHYASRYAEAFDKFVKHPQKLLRLWTVNSTLKKLQPRQRVTVARIVRVMLAHMTSDNNQIGFCQKKEMEGVTHKRLMSDYRKLYGESITEGRWYRAIKQLKNAGYLTSIDSLTIDNAESDNPIIRSIASLKTFTDLFFADLNLEHKKDIRVSRAKMTADRIKKGLSNIWAGYNRFNTLRKKRREAIHSAPATYDAVPAEYQYHIFDEGEPAA